LGFPNCNQNAVSLFISQLPHPGERDNAEVCQQTSTSDLAKSRMHIKQLDDIGLGFEGLL
jgi:hypothetical protein